jgi:hypothetical protein
LINRKKNKLSKHTDVYFSTLRYPQFNWVIEDFYIKVSKQKNKNCTTKYFTPLTAVSLANWIMDDGSFNKIKGNLILCTDSYSKDDLSPPPYGVSYRIRINKSSMPSLIELIKPYIIPSMLYKLGL